MADPLERRRLAGRHPSRMGRRRPGAGVAAARPRHLRRRRARACRRGSPPIDAVAVTQGPGLVGSLLVGVSFAKSFACARGVPVVPVHHLAGHIESLVLESGEMPLPAIVLVVSGGHTSLYRVMTPGSYELLGRTRDDAAGEAYDKVAKLLHLGYPGGPVVDRLARSGNDRSVPFPKMRLTHVDRNAPHLPGRRDFSFSGLKTSVLRHVTARRAALGLAASDPLPQIETADICASFQRVVVETLLDRLFDAASWYQARASASRAVCRRTAGCGPTPRRAARRRASRYSFRALLCRLTTPR